MLITNVQILTPLTEGGILRIENGFVDTNGGVIQSLGHMKDCPALESDLDAGGLILFPGFVDAHTHLGMWEDALGFEGDDGNEDTDPITPHLRAIDAINPLDKCFAEATGAGVLTAAVGPGSSNPIAGQISVIKTRGRCVDDMIVKSFCAIKFSLGENPKTTYKEKSASPVTRMATAALIREALIRAKRYMHALETQEEPPEFDFKSEALIPLLKGKVKAHFHAHRTDDIFTALRLAGEFGISAVIVHGTGGGDIADILAKHKIPVLAGPIICDRSKPELASLSPSTVGVLAGAGVLTSIVTDHPVTPAQYLTLSAAVAVNEGLGYEDALCAVTLNPARVLGVNDRVGSVEAGKDADICLYKSDPIRGIAKPAAVICGGVII